MPRRCCFVTGSFYFIRVSSKNSVRSEQGIGRVCNEAKPSATPAIVNIRFSPIGAAVNH